MKGLVMKEFLVMKKGVKSYAILLGFYLALSLMGVFSSSMFVSMMAVILLMIPVAVFSYDEQAKWDRYAVALPVSRKEIVGARYLFFLSFVGAALVLSVAADAILISTQGGELLEYVMTLVLCLAAAMLMGDVMLPINYKLGPEKARPFLFLVLGVPTAGVFLGFRFFSIDLDQLPDPSTAELIGLCGIVLIIAFVGMGISYWISCRIYQKKEF